MRPNQAGTVLSRVIQSLVPHDYSNMCLHACECITTVIELVFLHIHVYTCIHVIMYVFSVPCLNLIGQVITINDLADVQKTLPHFNESTWIQSSVT